MEGAKAPVGHTHPLGVLVELVANFKEVWVATEVPEVDLDLPPAHRHGLHTKVHADCGNVSLNELGAWGGGGQYDA